MEQTIKKYSELTDSEIKQVLDLILKGGEVNPQTLPTRLSEAALIAFIKDNNEVVATATIKKPLDSYKLDVFKKSKSDLSIDDYHFELGYIMVEEKFRKDKLASRLCEELCKIYLSQNLFATTRIDNKGMQSILKKNHFTEFGKQYSNKDNTDFLKLFIKNK